MPRPRGRRPRAERQAFFYRAQALDGEGWKRRDILRMVAALEGEERYLDADADSVLLPIVDHIPPRGRTLGRLRFFRVRRSNLPAVEEAGSLSDLPIAEAAGLAEPAHIVFAPDRVVVAEYNHFAPRMSALAYYLRLKLDRAVEFGTFIQDEVLEQLDRLGDVRPVQLTARPSDALRQDLAGDFIWGTVEQAGALDETKAVSVQLTARPGSREFTRRIKESVRQILGAGVDETASVFKIRGYDPETGSPEVIDLLRPKVMRRLTIDRVGSRSKALDTEAAYHALEEAYASAEADLDRASTLG